MPLSKYDVFGNCYSFGWLQLLPTNTFGAIGDSTGTSSPLPGGTVLNAAVPGGQLGNRQDRWKWISETMLVEWRKVENTPEIQATLRRFAELQ